jgi:hypothetical protein
MASLSWPTIWSMTSAAIDVFMTLGFELISIFPYLELTHNISRSAPAECASDLSDATYVGMLATAQTRGATAKHIQALIEVLIGNWQLRVRQERVKLVIASVAMPDDSKGALAVPGVRATVAIANDSSRTLAAAQDRALAFVRTISCEVNIVHRAIWNITSSVV